MPALARALDSFFTENKLPRRGVRLGLATNRIGVRAFDVDGIEDERQLDNAIRFRAHEAVSIPIDQAVLDYHIVGETVDEAGNVSRRILLAAAYRESIDRYVEACRAAKIELDGIDLEAFALLRAVGAAPAEAEATSRAAVVAVSLGHDRSTLAISDGSVCEFTRVLEWGGGKLEAAIASTSASRPTRRPSCKLAASLEHDADRERRPQAAAVREADQPRAAEARARARRVAPVLPEPARVARDLGDPALGRDEPDSGAARGARAPHARGRPPRRSARARAAPGDVQARDDLASLAIAIGLGVEA